MARHALVACCSVMAGDGMSERGEGVSRRLGRVTTFEYLERDSPHARTSVNVVKSCTHATRVFSFALCQVWCFEPIWPLFWRLLAFGLQFQLLFTL